MITQEQIEAILMLVDFDSEQEQDQADMRALMEAYILSVEDLNLFFQYSHTSNTSAEAIVRGLGSQFLRDFIQTNNDYVTAMQNIYPQNESTGSLVSWVGYALGIERLYGFIESVNDFECVFRDCDSSVFSAMCSKLGLLDADADLGYFNDPFDEHVNDDPEINPADNRLINCIHTAADLKFALQALYSMAHQDYIKIIPKQKLRDIITTKDELLDLLDIMHHNDRYILLECLGSEKIKSLLPTLQDFQVIINKYYDSDNIFETLGLDLMSFYIKNKNDLNFLLSHSNNQEMLRDVLNSEFPGFIESLPFLHASSHADAIADVSLRYSYRLSHRIDISASTPQPSDLGSQRTAEKPTPKKRRVDM